MTYPDMTATSANPNGTIISFTAQHTAFIEYMNATGFINLSGYTQMLMKQARLSWDTAQMAYL